MGEGGRIENYIKYIHIYIERENRKVNGTLDMSSPILKLSPSSVIYAVLRKLVAMLACGQPQLTRGTRENSSVVMGKTTAVAS